MSLDDPNRWRPMMAAPPEGDRPAVGDTIGVAYAAWTVVEARPVEDVDLDDEDRRWLALYKPEYREQHRPYTLVLRHDRGPILVTGTRKLHDGSRVIHLRVAGTASFGVHVLPPRYPVCSCHGDPWPCRDYQQDREAANQAVRLERILATAMPGVCAHCLEPITARQKTLSFPEPSLLVPGAPGPTFHPGRVGCWFGASEYETRHRLPAHPDATRLASCTGTGFVHRASGERDCSAGSDCTGHHGPRGAAYYCYTAYSVNGGPAPRPSRRCMYDDGRVACRGGAA